MITIPYFSTAETYLVLSLLIGTPVILLATLAFIAGNASKDLVSLQRRRVIIVFLFVLPIWFTVAMCVSMTQYLNFLWLLPLVILPIVLGTFATMTATGISFLRNVSVPVLVFMQIYRVLGMLFIDPYYTNGLLTKGFAMIAGIGDLITGVLAFFVAMWLLKNKSFAGNALVAWTIFGIVDLIVAPLSAFIFGFGHHVEFEIFPVSLIPLFLGPPFGILIHIVTLRAFLIQKNAKL